MQDEKSKFDAHSPMFDKLFSSVDKTLTTPEAFKLMNENQYDIIINDASVDFVEGRTFSKQIKKMKPEQEIVMLVSLSNEGELSEMVDLGIHAFLLSAEEFNQALEAISQMELN